MRTCLGSFVGLFLLLLTVAAVPASAGHHEKSGEGRMPPPLHKMPSFAELDADGNGSVSLAEFKAAHMQWIEKKFSRIDANGDTTLSKGEVYDARERMKARHAERKGKAQD